MGLRKKSIGKFSIGNRFHVKLRILSPEICKQSLPVKTRVVRNPFTAEEHMTRNQKTEISFAPRYHLTREIYQCVAEISIGLDADYN